MAIETTLCQMSCHFVSYFSLFGAKLLKIGNDTLGFVNKMGEKSYKKMKLQRILHLKMHFM